VEKQKHYQYRKPLKTGAITLERSSRSPLAFKIDIMLEKITTNPPINKMVEILLVILSANTSPKLEKVAKLLIFCLELELFLKFEEVLFFFQNLKIIPTVKEERRCVKKSKRPIVVFPKREIPNSTNNK